MAAVGTGSALKEEGGYIFAQKALWLAQCGAHAPRLRGQGPPRHSQTNREYCLLWGSGISGPNLGVARLGSSCIQFDLALGGRAAAVEPGARSPKLGARSGPAAGHLAGVSPAPGRSR